jgi:hypothetical protein
MAYSFFCLYFERRITMEQSDAKEAIIDIVKAAGAFVSSSGCVALICGVTRTILPPGVNKLTSGAMIIGGTILGGFIGDKLTDYVDDQIDSTVEDIENMAKRFKRHKDEPEENTKED